MDHRELAQDLVKQVHDPAAAAIVHALLALCDALGEPPPEEDEGPVQTAETWDWNGRV